MKAKADASRQAALVPLYGVVDKRPRLLDQELIIVGRARGCDIVLDAPEVSTLHCVLYWWGEGYRLRDCASRTGTRINGDPRKTAHLRDGDILQIGPFSFNVSLPQDSARDKPALSLPEQHHLQQSRRRLAQRALRLRKQLHQLASGDVDGLNQDLGKKASGLRARIQTFDQRLRDLEESERELVADREALAQAQEQHAAHVQKVEEDLVRRLADADAEIHQRWQEFQQRCQMETRLREEQRKEQSAAPPASSPPTPLEPSLVAEERRAVDEACAALALDQQELEQMQDQWAHDQAAAAGTWQQQQAAFAQAEAGLKEQRQQLQAMMTQLRSLQESIRQQERSDVGAVTQENEQLKQRLVELEAQAKVARRHAELDKARQHHAQRLEEENAELRRVFSDLEQQAVATAAVPADPQWQLQCRELREENEHLRRFLTEMEAHGVGASEQAGEGSDGALALRQENELLRQLLHEKDNLFEEMKQKVVAASTAKPISAATDLESYEAELTQDRQALGTDRVKLTKEIEQLRLRNQELDEATRDMEMELSRERAELARERQRLDRLRDEIRADQERMTRDGAVRESLAPVQKLREEMNQKKQGNAANAKGLGETMRSLRNRT